MKHQEKKKNNSNLNYAKMERYISLLEDAEKYQAEFKAVCAESLAMKVPYEDPKGLQ